MKTIHLTLLACLMGFALNAQQVTFEEYDLDNGLHVILHQDNTVPNVVVKVQYHVGSKDENPNKTGYAHFFEHLLFEGSKNIKRGEFDIYVGTNGGTNNASTSFDRTDYYELFPSNSLEMGLWLESERLLHPVIDQVGVDTQKEVVQEERRLRVDNSPYGALLEVTMANLFDEHPYHWGIIGSLDHLASGKLEDFQNFRDTYYVPNNGVLVVAGDIDLAKTKKMIEDYFGDIPRGADIVRRDIKDEPITTTRTHTHYDANIQIPMIINAYRTPGQAEREAYALRMISTYLTGGNSSKLYKKMVDQQKIALQVSAIPLALEDYSPYIILALPVGDNTLEDLQQSIDEEIAKIQNELISERDYQKLQNIFENNFITSNSSVQGIANSLADYYMFYGDTNLINSEIEIYRSITREELQAVAKKYLSPNQRLEISYLPKSAQAN